MADVAIGRGGVAAGEKAGSSSVALAEYDLDLPDLLGTLQDRTSLTRRTLAKILTGSGRLSDFMVNPQYFVRIAGDVIDAVKRAALVDGVRYRTLAGYYAQELFDAEELTGYLRNMIETEKSVHEHVVYDSGTEKAFAEALELETAVKVYAKLPGWFVVPTPLGGYNPDWAVLLETDEGERLYFVAETKPTGPLFEKARRGDEQAEIDCGERHFEAIAAEHENPAAFGVFATAEQFLQRAPG